MIPSECEFSDPSHPYYLVTLLTDSEATKDVKSYKACQCLHSHKDGSVLLKGVGINLASVGFLSTK